MFASARAAAGRRAVEAAAARHLDAAGAGVSEREAEAVREAEELLSGEYYYSTLVVPINRYKYLRGTYGCNLPRMRYGYIYYLFVNAFTQISGLSAGSGAVPKMLLWTYRSIHTLSQHAYVVRWPKKLKVNLATDPRMALPPRRFEAFPSMLAVNAAVQLYSRVLTSKTYGKCYGSL